MFLSFFKYYIILYKWAIIKMAVTFGFSGMIIFLYCCYHGYAESAMSEYNVEILIRCLFQLKCPLIS